MDDERKPHGKMKWWSIVILAVLLIAGCQNKELTQPIPEEPRVPSPSPSLDPGTQNENGTKKDSIEISSPQEDDKGPSSVTPPDSALGNRSDQKAVPVKETGLSLLSITLGTKKGEVIGRWGHPEETFVMEDESHPLLVYVYNGFSVGIDTNETVEFVEVHSTDIDPNLRGIKVGSKAEDAVRLLGQPDSKTDYILNYIQSDTVLRLDVDPQTQTIQSIKMFRS